MNLDMVRPNKKTEDVLPSINKNCETLIKQTNTKAQQTLEFKFNQSRITLSFKPPTSIEKSWMLKLTSLEAYKSVFNLTSLKIELYTDTFDEFSFAEVKEKLEEILNISKITPEHLHDKTIGPRIISAYEKLETERRRTDGYYMLLLCYARSPFRDFESYLRIVVGLDENDIQLILK